MGGKNISIGGKAIKPSGYLQKQGEGFGRNSATWRIGEMSYRDKTFCPKSAKDNPKCLSCNRFFDEQAYHNACDKAGYEIPVSWFLEPPCNKTTKERTNNDNTNNNGRR